MPDEFVTKAELATQLATLREDIHNDLIREFAGIATNINDLRTEVRQLSGVTQQIIGIVAPLPTILLGLNERLSDLTDRVRHLENDDG
jgi:hypothetical protein